MKDDIDSLKNKANWLRNKVLDMCILGGGHLSSSFSCIEIMTAIYYGGIFRFSSDNLINYERDRFILSKGHAASVLYAILADIGFFGVDELDKFCKAGSILGSHPDRIIPGVEVTTGSLGHGIGIAAGMSLAAKKDKKAHKIITLLGDGECSEGTVWEAAMFASFHQLDNLLGIIDHNKLCVTDFIDNCIALKPFTDKWRAFGWEVIDIDGHSFPELLSAFRLFCADVNRRKPFMIIAHTIKGKGVSFMENDPLWHAGIPIGDQIELAKKELSKSDTV